MKKDKKQLKKAFFKRLKVYSSQLVHTQKLVNSKKGTQKRQFFNYVFHYEL